MNRRIFLSMIFAPLMARAAAGAPATVTAYCACRKCCGKRADGVTASGKRPREGVTVAGPRRLRFGTRVHIEGVGWRVVQDRTARRFDGRFDVFFDDHAAAEEFGIRKAKVRIATA